MTQKVMNISPASAYPLLTKFKFKKNLTKIVEAGNPLPNIACLLLRVSEVLRQVEYLDELRRDYIVLKFSSG